jgi:hypothetical protein
VQRWGDPVDEIRQGDIVWIYLRLLQHGDPAIDVVQLWEVDDSDYLVLQHTSGDGPPLVPPFLRPGLLLRFDLPVSSSDGNSRLPEPPRYQWRWMIRPE